MYWYLTLSVRNADGTELSKCYDSKRNTVQEVVEALKKLEGLNEIRLVNFAVRVSWTEECKLYGKLEENFEVTVWYVKLRAYLCRSHYLKWCRENKPFKDAHMSVKPCTKAWHKMCEEEEQLFFKWLKKERLFLPHPKGRGIRKD
jgi:hypothetical protein